MNKTADVYSGEECSNDFLPLFMILDVTLVLLIIFFSQMILLWNSMLY